jgi:hypothetical protein
MLALFFAISLANQRIAFDPKDCTPHFPNEIDAPAVRDGLRAFASTPRGCEMIRRLDTREYDVEVFEETLDNSTGEAPPPSIATIIDAADHSKVKSYELILNPSFKRTNEIVVFTDEPVTPAQMMAAAWAAEMLHIEFYARGISLPHHSRSDFQEEWREIAKQLGFPRLTHGDEADDASRPWRPRARVIFWR